MAFVIVIAFASCNDAKLAKDIDGSWEGGTTFTDADGAKGEEKRTLSFSHVESDEKDDGTYTEKRNGKFVMEDDGQSIAAEYTITIDGEYEIFPNTESFMATAYKGGSKVNGKLKICSDVVMFVPSWGKDKPTWNIADIVRMEKGIALGLYLYLANGKKVDIDVYKKQRIIDELNARRECLTGSKVPFE